MTTFSLLFSSPFSWLPCAISPPCKFASLALKRPYFLWARSSTPKILRYGCCNVNQKMHIGNQGRGRANAIPHVYEMRSMWYSRFPRCARNEKGRRSSQKFPESTSSQLAAPGSFDSVVRMRSDSAQDDRGEMHSLSEGRFSRCARNEKGRRSSQKFPESTSSQLAAPGSFDSVVACAPTPLKMTEWECIRCCTGSTLALAGLFKTLTIELCGRANSIPHVYAFHVVQQIPRSA
jgi:hypothetical protein